MENQKIQYLENDAPLSDKCNTMDLANTKSKNIINARYDFKHHKPLRQIIDLYIFVAMRTIILECDIYENSQKGLQLRS